MKIVNNYRDLTMGKYFDILEVSKDNNLDELEKQVQIISLLSGKTTDEILDLPIGEYRDAVRQMAFLEHPSPDDKIRVARNYFKGGMELIPTTDFQNLTKLGEDKVVEVVSCFLVPKGCKYGKGYDIADVQKAIREEMTVAEVLALSAFFLRKFALLIHSSLSSCKEELKKLPKTEKTKAAMIRAVTVIRAAAAIRTAMSNRPSVSASACRFRPCRLPAS